MKPIIKDFGTDKLHSAAAGNSLWFFLFVIAVFTISGLNMTQPFWDRIEQIAGLIPLFCKGFLTRLAPLHMCLMYGCGFGMFALSSWIMWRAKDDKEQRIVYYVVFVLLVYFGCCLYHYANLLRASL